MLVSLISDNCTNNGVDCNLSIPGVVLCDIDEASSFSATNVDKSRFRLHYISPVNEREHDLLGPGRESMLPARHKL